MYKEIYDLCIPHMTHEQASLVEAHLSLMPRAKALEVVERAAREVS